MAFTCSLICQRFTAISVSLSDSILNLFLNYAFISLLNLIFKANFIHLTESKNFNSTKKATQFHSCKLSNRQQTNKWTFFSIKKRLLVHFKKNSHAKVGMTYCITLEKNSSRLNICKSNKMRIINNSKNW